MRIACKFLSILNAIWWIIGWVFVTQTNICINTHLKSRNKLGSVGEHDYLFEIKLINIINIT